VPFTTTPAPERSLHSSNPDEPPVVLFVVLFLASSSNISLNSTRHRRSEAIEEPAAYRLG